MHGGLSRGGPSGGPWAPGGRPSRTALRRPLGGSEVPAVSPSGDRAGCTVGPRSALAERQTVFPPSDAVVGASLRAGLSERMALGRLRPGRCPSHGDDPLPESCFTPKPRRAEGTIGGARPPWNSLTGFPSPPRPRVSWPLHPAAQAGPGPRELQRELSLQRGLWARRTWQGAQPGGRRGPSFARRPTRLTRGPLCPPGGCWGDWDGRRMPSASGAPARPRARPHVGGSR